ncbi:hypothetical protein GIB67_003123 [Kingdonia uniflora]|uniref:Uncharacterized protein n=1 Tax=Kingdonia uniflora TaxID=39325 RepID=A0A7J7N615_9MAGN|nr:hypothetical protein GIB67_003123 [Kingdonia uniflora]
MGVTIPAPFSDIGKQAIDLLTKDYNFNHKFTQTMLSGTGIGLISTGVKRDRVFAGNISTQYKSGSTIMDVKLDIHSNDSITVDVPIASCFGLTPTPFLDGSTAIGTKEFSLGGEVVFDTSTTSFTKYNTEIGIVKPNSLLLSSWRIK